MDKKVLILTASYGAGHNVASRTLYDFYEKKGYSVKLIDLVSFIDSFTGKTTQSFYQNFCSRFPFIWKLIYNILDYFIIRDFLFGIKYPIYQNKFDHIISEYKPDLVLSVFPFWGSFIKNNIDLYTKKYKTGIIITDSIKIHSVWYLGGAYIDKYFLIDNLSKDIFINKFNHKKDNLIVSFFPINSKLFIQKKEINVNNIYILLTGLKKQYIYDLLNNLDISKYNINIIKGRNDLLFTDLKSNYKDINFLEFINLSKNYKNIGIFIGKSGGATMSECIATDTVMLIPNYIPGQEEGNIKLIQEKGLGIFEDNGFKSAFLIKYLNWNKFLPNFSKVKIRKNLDIIFNNMK